MAALDAGELVADKRAFSQVYDRRSIPVFDGGGKPTKTIEVDVLRRRASTAMGLAGAGLGLACFAPAPFAYPITGTASLLFAGVWAAAHVFGDKGLATTARRMSTISLLMTIPIACNLFTALFAAAEIGAYRARSARNEIRFLPAPKSAALAQAPRITSDIACS